MTRVSAAAAESCARVVSHPSRALRIWRRWAAMRAGVRRAMIYAGPIAAVLMLLIMAGGVTWRLERSRLASLDAALRYLDLRAGELSRRLDATLSVTPNSDPEALLSDIASRDPGEAVEVLLADAAGLVRAIWPRRHSRPAT